MERESESDLLASIHPLLASCWAALDFWGVFLYFFCNSSILFHIFAEIYVTSLSLCVCDLIFAFVYFFFALPLVMIPLFSNVSGKFDSY